MGRAPNSPAAVARVAVCVRGFRFRAEGIAVALRWYLRYGMFYRDIGELLAERGIEIDHVTVYRWLHRFTRLLGGTWPRERTCLTTPPATSPASSTASTTARAHARAHERSERLAELLAHTG